MTMDTSAEQKVKIITLRQYTSRTIRQIASETGVHYSTVSRIVKKHAVLQVWNLDQKIHDSCVKLVESMPKRVKLVVKNRGGHIKY